MGGKIFFKVLRSQTIFSPRTKCRGATPINLVGWLTEYVVLGNYFEIEIICKINSTSLIDFVMNKCRFPTEVTAPVALCLIYITLQSHFVTVGVIYIPLQSQYVTVSVWKKTHRD